MLRLQVGDEMWRPFNHRYAAPRRPSKDEETILEIEAVHCGKAEKTERGDILLLSDP